MTEKRSTRLRRDMHKGLQGLMTASLLAALSAALVAGCTAKGGPSAEGAPALRAGPGRPGAIGPGQAKAFLAQHPEAWVLDVREPEEWNDELGHIEGALQIPLGELSSRMSEIEARKADPVVVVCRSGRRSSTATVVMAGSGFREVYNLDGGMQAWRGAGY